MDSGFIRISRVGCGAPVSKCIRKKQIAVLDYSADTRQL